MNNHWHEFASGFMHDLVLGQGLHTRATATCRRCWFKRRRRHHATARTQRCSMTYHGRRIEGKAETALGKKLVSLGKCVCKVSNRVALLLAFGRIPW